MGTSLEGSYQMSTSRISGGFLKLASELSNNESIIIFFFFLFFCIVKEVDKHTLRESLKIKEFKKRALHLKDIFLPDECIMCFWRI